MRADYVANPLYDNNPFIEALPPMLSGKDLIRALAVIPPYSDSDRDRSTGERLQLLSSLYEFYQPLSMTIDLYCEIYTAMQHCYGQYSVQSEAAAFQNGYSLMHGNALAASIGGGNSFSVVGVSGLGKSTALQRVLSLYPQVIEHTEYHGQMQSTSKEQTLNDLYGYFALEAALHNVQMYSNKDREIFVGNHCDTVLIDYKRNQGRRRPWHPSLTVVDNAPDQMREQLLRLFCGNYDTLLSTALCWLSPTEDELYDSLDDLKDDGIEVDKDAFLAVFNAWLLECGDKLALGQTIPDKVRKQVRKGFGGYGLGDDWTMPTTICDVMGWEHKGRTQEIWKNVLQRRFLEQNSESQKLYVDLKKVIPHYDPKHNWYRCAKCSCVTAFPLNDCCPNCGSKDIHLMDADALHALDFWREPSLAALHGAPIRVIDTEEHTAQLCRHYSLCKR